MGKKRFVFGLMVAVLSIFLVHNKAIGEMHSFGIRYTYLDYSVKNMPLDFRSVPIHEDDGYARQSNWGPIEDTEYDRNHWASLDYAYLWDLNERFSLGIGVIWILDFWDGFGEDRRRNYTNHPGTETRGYGAALTFVSTGVRGLVEIGEGENFGSLLNFTPQLVASYALNQERDLGIKLSASYHRFVALNGWDRYDKFEIKDQENLAHIFPVTMELYFKYCSFGASYNFNQLTDFGEKAEAEIGDFSFSFKFTRDFF